MAIIILVLSLFINDLNHIVKDPYKKQVHIDAINYAFHIELSDESDIIKVRSIIEVRFLKSGIKDISFDLIKKSSKLDDKGMIVRSVKLRSKHLKYTHNNDKLSIQLEKASQEKEQIKLEIIYEGIPASGLKIAPNKYGDRSFFSDNWPNKARNWLVTIDHPSDKAMCEFLVTAPNHYQVISNGLLKEKSDLENNMRLTHWKQSVPIAPWLFVLGVARFAIQYVDEFDGKSIQSWVYPQDREKGFYDYGTYTKQALEFYSDYVGPFEYEKLANIQSNSVGGGMEAASAIFYGDKSVDGKRSDRWRYVIVHEIAHHWFGNSVTENDWNEIWISEGFTTYFSYLFLEHQYGQDVFIKNMRNSKRKVDAFQEKQIDYQIVHDDLKDMKDVTTGQIYEKGAWVLHMLRGMIGDDLFWKGIQNYYAKYRNSHATVKDFIWEMEHVTDMELDWFFDQWLYQGGMLKYKGHWRYDTSSKKLIINLEQAQNDGYYFKMPMEIGVKYKDSENLDIVKIQLNKKSNHIEIDLDKSPETIILDPNFWVLMDADFTKK